MPHTDANGIKIYYEEHGTGEPLLLMAPTGWPGSVWDLEQVPFFSEWFRVITYDQRGVGRSDHADQEYSTALLAKDALALLHSLDATPAHVLGFSMGGRAAQFMALTEPSAFRSMVLAGTDAGRPGGGAGIPLEIALSLAEHGYEGYWQDHLNHEFPFSRSFRERHPEKVRALRDTLIRRAPPLKLYLRHVVARGRHDLTKRVHEIRVPTLVLVGADDRLSRGGGNHVAGARALAGAIPGAEFAVIDGARHLFTWEQPERANSVMLDFFFRHSDATSRT